MPKNNNSASRIVKLLKSIPHHSDNTSTLEVWTKLFGITESLANKNSHVVAERLGSVNRELELVRQQMTEQNFSQELYDSSIARLEDACSTMILNGTWNQVRQYLTSEVFVVMSFCGEIIPDEEEIITPEKLASIAASLEELVQSLSASHLPVRLRTLVKHHIELIRRALEEYPISGEKVFRRATQAGAGEAWDLREDVRRNADFPEIAALGAIWQEVRDECDIARRSINVQQIGHRPWNIFNAIASSASQISSET